MSDGLFEEHYSRVRAAVLRQHTLGTIPRWITENTFLRGEPFSFRDHEYQEVIMSDPSREKVVRKCSQVGLSELAARAALAAVNILDATTFIYTLPTATFAKSFTKTRIDPVILTSKFLRGVVNTTADNTEMKQFGNSFLYIKGTVGANAAISVPADGIINDEVDFSDAQVMSTYTSRLTHSPYKIKWRFSTPTVAGFGISADFETSRRHFNFCKCNHCAHWFLPDYFFNVMIPGYDGEKKDITKDRLRHLRWEEARVLCPSCGREPDLGPAHRQWVCENPDENFEAAGYQVQPFDAPRIVPIPYLVQQSTEYERFVDFTNFGLGLPAEDKESTLTRQDVDACYVKGEKPGFFTHVMGIDLGLTCHIMIGGVDPHGRIMVVHTELVPLAQIYSRKHELARQYRVALTVSDSQPYTEVLLRMQQTDANLFGAVYVESKDLAAFSIKKLEEEEKATEGDRKVKEGEQRVRQVNVNRNKAFDGLMDFVRAGNLTIIEDKNREIVTAHLQDMKRVKEFGNDKEVGYVWRKSAKGRDHFHHTLLYLWVAARMRGAAQGSVVLPWLMAKFPVKQKAETRRA